MAEQAQITVLEYPDNVRLRKGMYLPNMNHMIFEIVDNAIDEHIAGYCNNIAVAIQDNVITVEDDGRGIPVTEHAQYPGKSQAEIAYTVLHAGGKFGEEGGYDVKTGGLNGVGASCVNALSSELTLTIRTGGKEYSLGFEKGLIAQPLSVTDENVDPDITGTAVTFTPDPEIWHDDKLDLKKAKKRIQQLAYLNPGLTEYLYIDAEDHDGKRVKLEETYCYPEGLKAYIQKLTKNKTLVSEIMGTTATVNDIDVSIAYAYTDAYSEEIYTFCNNISTEDGGDHLTGFKMGLYKALTDYIKDDKLKFESDDAREGIVALISIKVANPNFDGQSKSKLKMSEVRAAVKKITEEYVFGELDHDPEQAKAIINKISLAAKAREAAKKAREATRKNKDLIEGGLPGIEKNSINNWRTCR